MRSIEVTPTVLDTAARWLVDFAADVDPAPGVLPAVGPDVQGPLEDLVASLTDRGRQLAEAARACASAVGAAADGYVTADQLGASW